MIRFACASCGKKFGVKDEHAGRRSKCPACGVQIEVPIRDAWEEEDASEPDPVRWSPAPPPVVPKPKPIKDDEPEPYRSPAKRNAEQKRPAWKDPVVIIGAIPVIVLAWFFGYLVRARTRELNTPSPSPLPSVVPPPVIQAPAISIRPASSPMGPTAPSTVRADGPTGDSIAVVEKEHSDTSEPVNAEFWRPLFELREKAFIEVFTRDTQQIEEVKVLSVNVKPLPRDDRKKPGLWIATASLAIKERSRDGTKPGKRATGIWKRCFQKIVPDGRPRQCWLEITEVETGRRSHTSTGFSEWNDEFRSLVAKEWLQEFEAHEEARRRNSNRDEGSNKAALQARKTDLARRLKIDVSELDEILQATE